jgi:multidrug resistance efflux pump
MTEETYKEALERARLELANALAQRDSWNLKIVRMQGLVKALSTRVAERENAEEYEVEANRYVNLMQAIEAIINQENGPMAPLQVREALTNHGYDLSSYANPMAMVHQTLRRLSEQGKIRAFPNGLYLRGFMLDHLFHGIEKRSSQRQTVGGLTRRRPK